MSERAPQNPIFQVDASAYEACRPKIICRQCGTVHIPRLRQMISTARCPSCGALHRVQRQGGKWTTELLTPPTE